MALNFEIDAGNAKQALEDIKKSAEEALTAVANLGNAADSISKIGVATESVKPVDAEVPASLDKTTEAAEKAGAAAAPVKELGEAIKGLNESAAVGASGPAQVGDGIEKMGAQASQSTGSMGGMAEAIKQFQQPLEGTAASLAKIGTSFSGMGGFIGGANNALTAFGEAAGGIPGILAAIALGIAGINFSHLSEEALKAAQQVENLQRALNVWSKEAHTAPEALEILDKTANRLGLPLEKLEQNFGKFAATAMSAGQSAKWAATAFDAVENAARSSGQGMAGAQRVLNTLDIWMANGTMTAGMLGRSLKEVGMTLDQIDPAFKGLSRNTQIGMDAMTKLLVAMNNIKTVMLTLQEQTERVSNSFVMMSAAFGRGQMAAEVDGMKAYADALEHNQTALNDFAYAVGYVYGLVQQLGDYIKAAAVEAFAGLVRVTQSVAVEFAKLGPLLLPVIDVIKDVGSAIGSVLVPVVGELLSLFGQGLMAILQGVIMDFNLWAEACEWVGRALGFLIGLVAGGLSNAWNSFINLFPKLRSEVNEASDDLAKLNKQLADDAAAKAAEAVKKNTEALAENARAAKEATLQQENFTRQTAAAAKAAAQLDDAKKNTIYANPDAVNADAAEKRSQAAANAYYQSLRSQSAQKNTNGSTSGNNGNPWDQGGNRGNAWDQGGNRGNAWDSGGNHGNVWDYNGGSQSQNDDLIHGTGFYDDRGRTDIGNGNSRNIGQAQPQPVFLADPNSGQPVDDGNDPGYDPLGAKSYNQIDGAQGGQTPVDNSGEKLGQSFDNAVKAFNRIPDAFKTNQQDQDRMDAKDDARFQEQYAQQQQQMAVDQQALAAQEDLNNGIDNLNSTVQDTTIQVQDSNGELTSAMSELGGDVFQNTISDVRNTDATVNQTMATEQLTNATEQDTAANYTDAASGGGSNDNSGPVTGGGGGGGQTDAQAQSTTQFDVGGIVGGGGGRPGPMLSPSAWDGAKHFADGGITDGGIPIIAHPNEAVIPLRSGAVPVSLGNAIPQAVANARETAINVGTLAHADAVLLLASIKQIDVDITTLGTTISSFASSNSTGSTTTAQDAATSYRGPSASEMYGAMKDGGVVGRWSSGTEKANPSAWSGAKHFADGGLTSGIPIVAHPDEAVIPLKSGAVPVSMGNAIPQAIMNLRESVINAATLAHTDSSKVLEELQKLDNDYISGFSSLQAMVSAMQSSSSGGSTTGSVDPGASSGGSIPPGEMYGGSGGGGGASSSGGSGTNANAPYGTVADYANGVMIPGSERPRTQVEYDLMRRYGIGRVVPTHPYGWGMGGLTGFAAGIDDTSTIPGMTAAGMPVMVHPDEAIVPLSRTRGDPVDAAGNSSGKSRGGNTTIIVHNHMPPAVPFGRGPSPDQIGQKIASMVNNAQRRIGTFTKIDDPTRRMPTLTPTNGPRTF